MADQSCGVPEQRSKYGVPLERSERLKLERNTHSCQPEQFAQWLEGYGRGRQLAVDLFSGAGGLSMGLKRAGWTVAAAVDFDERALETHAANFPGMSLQMDLGNPDERDRLEEILEPAKGKIDLVAGGPPCQPFSRAGRSKIRSLVRHHGRDPEDLRKELWRAYLDVVKRIRPRAVLMENVPDMGFGDDFFVVRTIEQQLEELGYATQVRLVDAWRYGVPQHRKRLILLARNDIERFRWREDQEGITTLRDAIGDLPELKVEPRERVGGREWPYTRRPGELSGFAEDMRKQAPKDVIWDHMTRRVRADDFKIFSQMNSTTLYSEIDPELQRYDAGQFTDKYKKLGWNELSRSITAHIAKDGYWYIHPEQNRTLTVREAARVQTFPDHFRFAGTRSDAFRQIGNAVPPLLGEAAAEVLTTVPERQHPEGGLRPHWRTVREDLTAWAEKQRASDAWYQLPGELSPVAAAVAAVLSSSRMKAAQLEAMVAVVKARKTLTRSAFSALSDAAPSAAARARVDRLSEVVGRAEIWKRPENLPEVLGMKPGEASLYRLLTGEDLLWMGQGALRVAARLHDSESDRTNRLSDGRVDLVKLVGAGPEAPLRMAALRLIGLKLCRSQDPICYECPLSKHCEGKADAPADLFTEVPD